MTLTDALTELGQNNERVLTQLWERYAAGDIDADTLAELSGPLLATVNARGWTLGALSVAGYIAAVTGAPVGVAALPVASHYVDVIRLSTGVRTVLNGPTEQQRQRLARLATAEPTEAAQRGQSAAMEQSPIVEGWVRDLEPDGCELCRWWWREGRIWHPSHHMPTHTGCQCTARPVLVAEASIQYTWEHREAIWRQRAADNPHNARVAALRAEQAELRNRERVTDP